MVRAIDQDLQEEDNFNEGHFWKNLSLIAPASPSDTEPFIAVPSLKSTLWKDTDKRGFLETLINSELDRSRHDQILAVVAGEIARTSNDWIFKCY